MAQSLQVNKANAAPLLAEFLGTAVLVMVTLVLSQTTAVAYFIGTSVALALGVAYMMFSGVSGGHFNPAITLGVWATKKVTQNSTIKAVAYIVAQVLGALASWQLYQYFINQKLTAQPVKYSLPLLVAEAVGTLILALGFAAAATRAFSALESALTYGFSLFVGIMVAATASAAFLNPAVALGLRNFKFNWVYTVGPLIGAVIGIGVYKFMFEPTKTGSVKSVVAKARKVAGRRR